MAPLPAHEILRLWDQGQRQHPVDRALALLAAANPEKERGDLAALTIGQRDSQLIALREQTFGAALHCYAECSHCAERLEFSIALADLRAAPSLEGESQELELTAEGFTLRFRLPNSFDLAALVNCGGTEAAHQLLLTRCLLGASRDGESVSAGDLTDAAIEQMAARMSECDPQAETLLELNCPACGHRWQAVFEIGSFLWAEIGAEAKRLMREVHTLARAYGWREADILSLSPARRQFYLEMVA